jgi:hypothetical protein
MWVPQGSHNCTRSVQSEMHSQHFVAAVVKEFKSFAVVHEIVSEKGWLPGSVCFSA